MNEKIDGDISTVEEVVSKTFRDAEINNADDVIDNPDEVGIEDKTNQSTVYLDDDEEFLRGDDEILHTASDIGLFKQEDGVISWELVNFFKENGSPRGKYALKNDPPLLKIASSGGESVEFLVTQNFAKSLSVTMDDIYKAYFGIQPNKTKKTLKEKIDSTIVWFKENKIKTIALCSVIGVIVASALIL